MKEELLQLRPAGQEVSRCAGVSLFPDINRINRPEFGGGGGVGGGRGESGRGAGGGCWVSCWNWSTFTASQY